jgi:hypothetical protein
VALVVQVQIWAQAVLLRLQLAVLEQQTQLQVQV